MPEQAEVAGNSPQPAESEVEAGQADRARQPQQPQEFQQPRQPRQPQQPRETSHAHPALPVDWDALMQSARAALAHAYVPYSKYPVGAAAQMEDGRVVSGCNVENASYGLTLCAECSLVSAIHMSGGGRIAAFVCVDGQGEVLMPCGRCRQLLYEHRGPEMQLLTVSGIASMDQVLPDAFGPENLH